MVKVELDQSLKEGVYWAHLMTANIRYVNIAPQIVAKYERLLMAGAWSKVVLHYEDSIRHRGKTYPFVISRLDPIQVSHVDLAEYCAGREQFPRDQWIDVLIRTMGYEPTHPNRHQVKRTDEVKSTREEAQEGMARAGSRQTKRGPVLFAVTIGRQERPEVLAVVPSCRSERRARGRKRAVESVAGLQWAGRREEQARQ